MQNKETGGVEPRVRNPSERVSRGGGGGRKVGVKRIRYSENNLVDDENENEDEDNADEEFDGVKQPGKKRRKENDDSYGDYDENDEEDGESEMEENENEGDGINLGGKLNIVYEKTLTPENPYLIDKVKMVLKGYWNLQTEQ